MRPKAKSTKYLAKKVRELAKLILKERAVTDRLIHRTKNVVHITGKSWREINLLVLGTLATAYPEDKVPNPYYMDISGFLDAATMEDNWAYTSDLPSVKEIMEAMNRGAGTDNYQDFIA